MPSQISVAIVGADFLNRRGKVRGYEVKRCSPGEILSLRLEAKNAVAVFSARGVQIGYVRTERSTIVGAAVRAGKASAIYQCTEPWGATVRISLDGSAPTLPDPGDSRNKDWPPPLSDDPDWLPDHLWPDQCT